MIPMAMALLSFGCAETIGVQVLRPAEINLRGTKKIALGQIVGSGGEEMSGELTTALFNSQRFEVLDRQNLDKLLAEQQLSSSTISDPDSAVKAGKVLGAAALVLGTVSRHDYAEMPVKRENFEKPVEGGKMIMTRYTRAGAAKVSTSFRITDLTTGMIIASRTISEEAAGTTNNEVPAGTDPRQAQPDPIDGQTLLTQARAKVVERFMRAIAPYYETLPLPFEKSGDLPELEQGITLVKANDWPNAATKFRTAVARAASAPPKAQAYAHLDLGIALCFGIGDFDAGLASLRTALSLKNDSKWVNVMNMCNQRKVDAARLEAQGANEPTAMQQ
jgi:hypothetical protein